MRIIVMGVHVVLFTLVVTLVTASTSKHTKAKTESKSSFQSADQSPFSSIFQGTCFSKPFVGTATDASLYLPKDVKNLHMNMIQMIKKTCPRHCQDLQDAGDYLSGLRLIHPYPGQPHRRLIVYCDQTTDGGGWTVFQRRKNTTVRENFFRTWAEYKLGFGNKELEFWLGLDHIHALTSTALQELRIDLADWEGHSRYAKYGYFYVGDEDSKYLLLTGRYRGNAGNSMKLGRHSGNKFSTHDADNDPSGHNCARKYRGAWWYKDCHNCNLNGYQYVGKHSTFADGINWKEWKGYHYSLRETTMMIRPAF